MNKKIDLDSVEFTMANVGISEEDRQKVIADLQSQLEALQEEKQPRTKKTKYIIARTDIPEDTAIDETPMTVIEVEEDVPHTSIIDTVKAVCAFANNDHKRFKKDPIKNIFDGVERVPAKYFKEKKIRVLSRGVTHVLTTDNTLD